jgi:hypothetical protein
MHIDKSHVSLYGFSASTRTHTRTEDLTVWDNRKRSEQSAAKGKAHRTSESLEVRSARRSSRNEDLPGGALSPRLFVLLRIVEKLTGRKINLPHNGGETSSQGPPPESSPASAGTSQEADGWGLQYDLIDTTSESQKTTFQATGTLTADGKEVAFSVSFELEQSSTRTETQSVRAGDAAKDPLILNMESNAATLAGDRIAFDFNSDGESESMPFVGSGSGFLVIDKNGNAAVDNGSELFGPTTGDGFTELSGYDEDKNGWIDEDDSVYSKLSLWRQKDGRTTLETLASVGIGAIYTGRAETAFELKDESRNANGYLRQSGIYVTEDGQAGTIQKLDLVL